jgi:hypothetical protein
VLKGRNACVSDRKKVQVNLQVSLDESDGQSARIGVALEECSAFPSTHKLQEGLVLVRTLEN